jgi:formyl-CoA transferase
MDGARKHPGTAPPELGADNSAIWSELGLSQDEIDALKKEGII